MQGFVFMVSNKEINKLFEAKKESSISNSSKSIQDGSKIYCTECGSINKANYRFCPNCGNSLRKLLDKKLIKPNEKENQYKVSNPQNCNHEFRLLYHGNWNWRLVWECVHCGYLCHCKCFETVIQSVKLGKIKSKKKYTTISGTEAVLNRNYRLVKEREINWIMKERGINLNELGVDLNNLPFYENACEVCRNQPSTHKYCHKMYVRSEFEIRYGAYIKKKFLEMKLENPEIINEEDDKKLERHANNIVREELGFRKIGERFISETELYRIIKSIFPETEVVHHYRGNWLEGQEIDIYVPKFKIAIEYDGIQHFKPITTWGGVEGLKKTRERDKLKNEKCLRQNVQLIRFSYKENENLNKSYVVQKIKNALNG